MVFFIKSIFATENQAIWLKKEYSKLNFGPSYLDPYFDLFQDKDITYSKINQQLKDIDKEIIQYIENDDLITDEEEKQIKEGFINWIKIRNLWNEKILNCQPIYEKYFNFDRCPNFKMEEFIPRVNSDEYDKYYTHKITFVSDSTNYCSGNPIILAIFLQEYLKNWYTKFSSLQFPYFLEYDDKEKIRSGIVTISSTSIKIIFIEEICRDSLWLSRPAK